MAQTLLKRTLLLAAAAAVLLCVTPARAQFRELLGRVPRSANAVVILNLEKVFASPTGVREDWKRKVEEAFEAGVVRVPPQTARGVLAAQIDFQAMQPMYEAIVVDLRDDVSIEKILAKRERTADTIEGLPAAALANNAYVVQFGAKTLGAMAPSNRQSVVRWVREAQSPSAVPLSAYLTKAAGYSDDAGTEIIMAIDLEGAFSLERIVAYLKTREEQTKEWNADLKKTAEVLQSLKGLRVGVRTGQTFSSKVTVDFGEDVAPIAVFAKPLLLQILADAGARIDDLDQWQPTAIGSEISLTGVLSRAGLRKLMSFIGSPAPAGDLAKAEEAPMPPPVAMPAKPATPSATSSSPGELSADAKTMAAESRKYFRAVTDLLDDLKDDLKSANNLASTRLWFDKYAKRIDRMPMLGVDPEVLNYGAYVAEGLRQASYGVQTMGIQSGVRQQQIISSGADAYAYGSVGVGYIGGTFAVYDPWTDFRNIQQQRRVVRAEETAKAATNAQSIRQQLIQATSVVRRRMTEKYQLQF